jgi:hypothetical protein
MQPTTLARAMWTLYEPIHAITYFAAEARAEFEQAGCGASGADTSPDERRR